MDFFPNNVVDSFWRRIRFFPSWPNKVKSHPSRWIFHENLRCFLVKSAGKQTLRQWGVCGKPSGGPSCPENVLKEPHLEVLCSMSLWQCDGIFLGISSVWGTFCWQKYPGNCTWVSLGIDLLISGWGILWKFTRKLQQIVALPNLRFQRHRVIIFVSYREGYRDFMTCGAFFHTVSLLENHPPRTVAQFPW